MKAFGPVALFRRAARGRGLAILGLAALAACTSTDAPLGPEGFAATGGATASFLDITVVAPNGQTLVPGATVRLYGMVNGAIGPVATGLTDAQGFARFDVAPGAYCVSARVAPPEWLSLDIITPPQPIQYTSVGSLYGPVVSVPGGEVAVANSGGGAPAWVAFSPTAFESCYTDLPVVHVQGSSAETVPLATPFFVKPQVLGLDGEPLTGIDVFAVLPVDVPWVHPSNPEIKTAFFSLVDQTASPADMVVSPNAPYALEFQQPFSNFNITGTTKGMGGPAGDALSFDMEAAPLLCKQTIATFDDGGRRIDFLEAAYGYHATLVLTPDPSIVPVTIKHTGNGPVTVTFRTDVPNGQLTTTVDFTCRDGECGEAKVKTPGRNDQTVQIFHMDKGAGIIKTTVVLSGIPANHRRVLFAAKTPGDKIPLTSRDDASSAFFILERPAVCSVVQSNDDKWAVGDI